MTYLLGWYMPPENCKYESYRKREDICANLHKLLTLLSEDGEVFIIGDSNARVANMCDQKLMCCGDLDEHGNDIWIELDQSIRPAKADREMKILGQTIMAIG